MALLSKEESTKGILEYHLRDSTSSACSLDFVGKAFLLLSEKSSPFRGLRPYVSIVYTWKLRSSSPLSCGTDSDAGQEGSPRVSTSEVDPGFSRDIHRDMCLQVLRRWAMKSNIIVDRFVNKPFLSQ
jgi:hypothetical protein